MRHAMFENTWNKSPKLMSGRQLLFSRPRVTSSVNSLQIFDREMRVKRRGRKIAVTQQLGDH